MTELTLEQETNTLPTELLWQEFRTRLLRFIRQQVADPDAAEDILQEVFLRIHTHLDSLRNQARLEGWLYQITRNAIVDYYRAQGRTVDLDAAETLPAEASEDPSEASVAASLAPCLQAMLAGLPPVYRQALELTAYQGWSQAEMAQRLGISFSGAKSRVQRARRKLQATLLACCAVELDRRQRVIAYQAICEQGREGSQSCGCGGGNGCQAPVS
jgi:RNA polymerase sigma-70 factor (ECF subfamily)